jgi:hypothetical protein
MPCGAPATAVAFRAHDTEPQRPPYCTVACPCKRKPPRTGGAEWLLQAGLGVLFETPSVRKRAEPARRFRSRRLSFAQFLANFDGGSKRSLLRAARRNLISCSPRRPRRPRRHCVSSRASGMLESLRLQRSRSQDFAARKTPSIEAWRTGL